MGLNDVPFGSAVTNPATGDQTVLIGVSNTLTIQLVNNSGAAIALAVGPQAATFGIYLPGVFFTLKQLQAMQVTADGWTAQLDTSSTPVFNVSRIKAATWAENAILTFTFGDVEASGSAGNDSVAIIPANMEGNVPLEVDPPLVAASPPKPGNLKLSDVLQVTLDSQGTMLRSASAADPLTNTLYLTLKNTGENPLASGGTRAGNPQVTVSFVYGNTSGSLAPDGYDQVKGAPVGSAWNIKADIESAPGQLPWAAADPAWAKERPHPQWTLTPAQNNLQILGGVRTDQANVTFSLSGIVSVTPPGHTQLLVLCDGFARDDKTAYDKQLYVLDIVKTDPPAIRGLLSFFGPDPVIEVSSPATRVAVPLRWSMFDVASVRLLTSSPAVAPVRRVYSVPPKPVDYDRATVSLPAPSTSQAVFCTLQAFDGGGGYLNSQQFTAYVQVSYVIDAGGHVYPVALFGDTFWMLENYRYPAAGSYDYGDNSGNEATFGRLYSASVQPPDGWSVPTAADWNALFGHFGDPGQAYTALAAGGNSGFNGQLGGWRNIQPNGAGSYQNIYSYGYYLAAPGNACAQFSAASKRASVGTTVASPATALSARFIRHA